MTETNANGGKRPSYLEVICAIGGPADEDLCNEDLTTRWLNATGSNMTIALAMTISFGLVGCVVVSTPDRWYGLYAAIIALVYLPIRSRWRRRQAAGKSREEKIRQLQSLRAIRREGLP